MKAREYCCCAIPIVNAGIYAVLLEQFALGIIAGTLSVATPSSMSWHMDAFNCFRSSELTFSVVVGAATPGAAKWIFAIVCYIGAGLQLLGFVGVSKVSKSSSRESIPQPCDTALTITQEKHVLFKRYLSLDWFITIAVFSISVAWIIISATRHSAAQANCEKEYYTPDSTGNTAASLADASDTVCNIFSWVDVGIMGGLWVVLLLMQVSAMVYICPLRMVI